MVLGITGGLGCGKSTAARFFEERGFRRIDADAVVREEILTSPPVMEAIRMRFGGEVFDALGAVNRSSLARIVFTEDEARLWLEGLVHPRLEAIKRARMAAEPGTNWAVEVPLLFEKSLEKGFDFTLCIACDENLQLARLERRGMNRLLAGQRISKQLPLARKVELADFVLWNDGSTEFLRIQVDQIIETLGCPSPA